MLFDYFNNIGICLDRLIRTLYGGDTIETNSQFFAKERTRCGLCNAMCYVLTRVFYFRAWIKGDLGTKDHCAWSLTPGTTAKQLWPRLPE